MLNFLHDQRVLIHFDDTKHSNRMVILDPQWLKDVFKEVITVRPCQSKERKYEQLWLKLETTESLKEELLQHVWGPLFGNRETCHTLIAMMEKFCLLCSLSSSVATDSPTKYLVTSMLKFPPLEDVSKPIAFAGIPLLYLKFKGSQCRLAFSSCGHNGLSVVHKVCCLVCCANRSVNHCYNHNVRGCKEKSSARTCCLSLSSSLAVGLLYAPDRLLP